MSSPLITFIDAYWIFFFFNVREFNRYCMVPDLHSNYTDLWFERTRQTDTNTPNGFFLNSQSLLQSTHVERYHNPVLTLFLLPMIIMVSGLRKLFCDGGEVTRLQVCMTINYKNNPGFRFKLYQSFVVNQGALSTRVISPLVKERHTVSGMLYTDTSLVFK